MNENDTDDNQSVDYRDAEWLRQRYHEDELLLDEMADLADVAQTTILYWMEERGIDRRPGGVRPEDLGPERDAEWLRRKYHDEGLSTYEMADLIGKSAEAVSYWMDKHNIQFRSGIENEEIRGSHTRDGADGRYCREDWLRERYIKQGCSVAAMAREAGVAKNAISDALERHGIEQRSVAAQRVLDNPGSGFGLTPNGYEYIRHEYNGTTRYYLIHRLVAIAEYGYDEVMGKTVHHKNGVKWDNRHGNLELMTEEEHSSHHIQGRERAENGQLL